MELNLSRQSKLVPVDKIEDITIKVFGVGSVGSHVVKTLAKTGFNNIEVYDMDIVEEENLAAQAFDFKHLKQNKVDAIKDIVKESSGVDIIPHHGVVTEETDITPEPNTVYMCFFDSFSARKLVFDKLKDFPVLFVDGRIGRYDMRYYFVDCINQDEVKSYAKTLESTADSGLECGEKASAPINTIISGQIVMNLINYLKEENQIKTFIGNASTPKNNIYVLKNKPEDVETK